MRLAVVSDIHGNLPALEAVIADIRGRDCDIVVNLGDILSGPLWPAETADLLLAHDWPTIRGNHERELLETPREAMGTSDAHAFDALREAHRAWLATLPATRWLADDGPGAEVFLCHGTPDDDMGYFVESPAPGQARAATVDEVAVRAGDCRAPVILCGHTHRPRIVPLADDRLVVNPGSVGLPAIHVRAGVPHAIETGSPHARYALLERGARRWQARIIDVEYDHRAAARKATQNGRPDWAHALQTGRIPPESHH
ncbi:metallophosphoesterase family protein [Marilutibacter alkalisoli]|uniref:Metallophosphoesterase family protein n=1 Tax=Marilutibacter alkalisoli TaxID=2591633 RepID=A0A514BSV6_9GAMM|nr:metallophosphoesterase family protein [Lysobacter alkalisoli]QDH70466.1 metallophosphoesterase family protein [Lysobacter alkalisoli]